MKDLIGRRFSRLVVISVESIGRRHVRYNCVCDCGKSSVAQDTNLETRHTRSCGCLALELSTKHGHSKTRTYNIWKGMMHRCLNPKNDKYHRYGAKGITVHESWRDFLCFLKDMGEAPDGLTLDRENTNGNYEPGNCRWVSMLVQQNNRNNNRIIEHQGIKYTLSQASKKFDIPWSTLNNRIFIYGWSIETAISTPTRRKAS